MDARFHVFIIVRPINHTLTVKLGDYGLEQLLKHDVALHATTGDPDVDEYFFVTLQAVTEAIRQINDYNKLDDAVAMIYDVSSHQLHDDGHVSQEADVKVFGSYAMFKRAKDSYEQQQQKKGRTLH
jgi:hypothetical protein